MSRKLFIIIAGAVTAIAVLIAWLSSSQGNLVVEVNQLSPIKEDIEVYLSSKRYPNALTPPVSQKIRTGTYELVAYAPGAAEFRETIRIRSGQTTSVSLTLNPDLSRIDQQELTLTAAELDSALYQLFPHQTDSYSAQARFGRNDKGELVVEQVIVTPFLPVSPSLGYDAGAVEKAKAEAIAAVKKWLGQNRIPASVPVTVSSAY